jgi:hypothetical protein
MTLGVLGCLRELPDSFPVETPENSGNMIHGNAPFEMFSDAVHSSDKTAIRAAGSRTFVEFVNRNCSHLVLTMANTLKLNADNGSQFARLQSFLEKIEKPVVVFGLGVQAHSDDITGSTLPPEAVALMRHLSTRSPLLGVRGQMTQRVLKDICGVGNSFVTGCPSLFSRPRHLASVRANLENPIGRPSYNGTKYHLAPERKMLHSAIRADHFLVEPVNKFNHQYHVDVSGGQSDAAIPYFLKSYESTHAASERPTEMAAYFRSNYRLFRDVKSWYKFNKESVSYSYGTRFHANMASILSGKPALWVTHDARTRELVDFFHLPSLPEEACADMEPAEIIRSIDYDDFLDNIEGLFANFNSYLGANGMPEIDTIKI